MTILDRILAFKRREIAARKKKRPLGTFVGALAKSSVFAAQKLFPENNINLIGEIKRKSPSSARLLRERDLPKLSKLYGKYCVAVSVLTDEKFFGGSLDDIKTVKQYARLPILQKDFIIDEYQIYEARRYGADLVLLIAAILSEREIKKFLRIVAKLSMHAIVEVHTRAELQKALRAGAKIIGVNSRNLKTFSVNLRAAKRLARLIPKNKIVIAESGIRDRRDIELLKNDVRGFLVGTSILKSLHPEKKLRELLAG